MGAAVFAAFIPTLIRLYNGPWQTEQEGHGPIVIAAAGWLAWQAYRNFRPENSRPAYVAGWLVLLLGLAVLVVMRSQDVLMLETAAQIPIICGAVLLVSGWQGLKAFAFPIAFLLFAVPPPGWMMDIFTVPMKLIVSDWATELLYRLDFPIAQNGVMIMVGPYQLMVKDACSGMNSVFALSAIGFFYVHEFIRNSPVRVAVMLASIIPITVAANFVRVLALILIAYYFGVEAVEGVFHDLTGFLLFAVALALFFLLDVILIGVGALFRRLTGKGRPASKAA
ncbi:exosortase [uncultured Rhodoblastus sp.]|uniref:exosortase n=1 Tax=uncultured Rhodoblastus sp. TaxID=543037 RepID=UPI0025DC846B|nr:exosortase [uncultured Rhodoblastus sp.]